MSKYKYLSFFSGALGLDIGLEKAGLECLAVNEFDKQACETIKINKPDLKLYDCDIRNLTGKQLLKDLNLKPKELFLIVGGCPCQAFSTVGKRLGLADERGNVALHFLDIISEVKPQYVIIENVRGLLSSPLNYVPHKDRDPEYGNQYNDLSGSTLFYLCQKLKQSGYSVSFNLYDTSLFGVPQKRERIVLIASLGKTEVPYLSNYEKKIQTVKDALKNVSAQEWVNFRPKHLKFFKKLSSGQNWKNLSVKDQKEAMGASFFSGGGKTGFYRRLDWNKPSPTLVTSPIMPATMIGHPQENRPLSVEEYAAIQTFPANYQFVGKTLDKYKQIGNAVPCLFGQKIGEHLINFHEGKLEPNHSISFSRYKNTDHKSWIENFKKQISKK